MKTLYTTAFVLIGGLAAVAASAAEPAPSYSAYVVAVDSSTIDPGWRKVVDALKRKHSAKVMGYKGSDGLDALLPELKKIRPMYVCFVARPEAIGKRFVVEASQMLRKIDDDPYGDAIWGIVTGYSPEDALKAVNAPSKRTIRSLVTSMGGDNALDGYTHGFASDERTADNFWVKRKGGATVKVPTGGNPAKVFAESFGSIPVDYFVTSGHASERDWQIVYNQNRGSLVHTPEAGLQFVDPVSGGRYDVKGASLKVYLGAGNCLIGDVDARACMATAWMHTAGVEHFAGYVVPSWYGFMGWGTKDLFECGRYSLPEARFLTNERLLWARTRKHGNMDERGLDYDRDVFALYGDPKQRIVFPEDRMPYNVRVEGSRVTVKFTQDCDFKSLGDVKGAYPVMAILTAPPPGGKLLDAEGKEVPDSVVTERFIFIPATGHHVNGETRTYKIAS